MKRILFVCTGNICRSPTADGVARHLAAELGLAHRFEFDSAGTQAFHTGEKPDSRARNAALKRGYDLSGLRARQVCKEDFELFDLILAMDKGHLAWLRKNCPRHLRDRIEMFLAYSSRHFGEDVPDPYYGDSATFEFVLNLCEDAVREILRQHA